MMHLLCSYILISILLGCLTFELKFFLILLLLHQFDFVLIAKCFDILLLEFIHFDRLFDLPLLAELWVEIVLALTGDKPCHVLFDKWLLNDLNDTRSRLFIFDQKHVDQVLHSLTVSVRYWLLFILHNLKNQSE